MHTTSVELRLGIAEEADVHFQLTAPFGCPRIPNVPPITICKLTFELYIPKENDADNCRSEVVVDSQLQSLCQVAIEEPKRDDNVTISVGLKSTEQVEFKTDVRFLTLTTTKQHGKSVWSLRPMDPVKVIHVTKCITNKLERYSKLVSTI